MILAFIIAVIVVIAVYSGATYYSSARAASLESQVNALRANNTALAQNYKSLETQYTVLQVSFNNTYTAYITLRGALAISGPMVIYQSKSLVLQSILYPSFVDKGYNVSYLAFFEPTQTYIYYNSFKYPPYSPLEYINASYSYYNFNLTEPESGYLVINYTSNSPNGLQVLSNNCSSQSSSPYAVSEYSVANPNADGSIQLPINKGTNCVYIENPSNGAIGVKFSATLYGYAGS